MVDAKAAEIKLRWRIVFAGAFALIGYLLVIFSNVIGRSRLGLGTTLVSVALCQAIIWAFRCPGCGRRFFFGPGPERDVSRCMRLCKRCGFEVGPYPPMRTSVKWAILSAMALLMFGAIWMRLQP